MCSDRSDVENLLEQYCWLVDHGQWEEWSHCFAPDGVFDVRGQELTGREAIVAYVKGSVGDFQLLRHLSHHPSVHLVGAEEASARSYFEMRGKTAQGRDVEALGSYEDDLVRTGEGWQFKRRRARFDYFVRRGEPWDRGGD